MFRLNLDAWDQHPHAGPSDQDRADLAFELDALTTSTNSDHIHRQMR